MFILRNNTYIMNACLIDWHCIDLPVDKVMEFILNSIRDSRIKQLLYSRNVHDDGYLL